MVSNQIASKKGNDNQGHLDLIVFPELAVHPDDMWLLSRLSDQTKATIFAGQTFVEHPYLNQPINRAVWLIRQKSKSGHRLLQAFQGKQHGTTWERGCGIVGHRPFQVVVRFKDYKDREANLSGVICYDSTDLKLAADLREVTDGMLISALNPDINTFDTMVRALQYLCINPSYFAIQVNLEALRHKPPLKKNLNVSFHMSMVIIRLWLVCLKSICWLLKIIKI